MYSPLKTPIGRRERARRVAALLAAYTNGDHLAVSGRDARRALTARARQKG